MIHQFFATCAHGLEEVLADELRDPRIGGGDVKPGASGVHFTGELEVGYRANLWVRTAIRVLDRMGHAPAPNPDRLYAWARGLPWERFMTVDQTLSVDARVRDSKITHSRYAAFRIKDAICDRFRDREGRRPDVDVAAADLPLFLYVYKNESTLYRDLSGQTLHKRGYRSVMHKSSLNECLAAGMVLLSGWNGEGDLLDPMCGSATIAIEAALIALNRAPGLMRKIPFPFERWPGFDRKLWGELRTEARDLARKTLGCRIMAADQHAGAISLARRDISSARLDNLGIGVVHSEIEYYHPPSPPAAVITNPPWGERLRDEAEASWRKLGAFLKARCGGASAWVLSGNPELTRFLYLKAGQRHPLRIGRTDCRVIRYDVHGRD